MENYNIKDLLKAGHVTRWHTVDTVKVQTLAEHQWNVCMISVSLACAMGLDDSILNLVILKALIHDMEEVWTGDLPSPYKEGLKRTGGSPRNTVRGVPTYIPGLSSEAEGRPPVDPEIYHNTVVDHVVAAADRLDAYIWSKKYVLDPSVVNDCYRRLCKLLGECKGTPMETAINQILLEAF